MIGPFRRSDFARAAVVGGVDPVVDAEAQIGDAAFGRDGVAFKAGEPDFAQVGLVVAVGVLEIEDVGGGGRQDSSLPGQHRRDLQKMVGEDRGLVDAAVAVGVFEVADTAARLACLPWDRRGSRASRRRRRCRFRRKPFRPDRRLRARRRRARAWKPSTSWKVLEGGGGLARVGVVGAFGFGPGWSRRRAAARGMASRTSRVSLCGESGGVAAAVLVHGIGFE